MICYRIRSTYGVGITYGYILLNFFQAWNIIELKALIFDIMFFNMLVIKCFDFCLLNESME